MVRPGVSIRRMEKTRYSGKLFPKRFRSALTWGLVVGTCIRGKLLYVYAKCAWCTACAHETLIGSFKWCSKNSLQDHCSRWTLLILAILFLVCDTPNQTIFFFMHPVIIVIEISWKKLYVCLQDFEANEDVNSIVQHSLTSYKEARYVRLIPTSISTHPCVRVEIYIMSWKRCCCFKDVTFIINRGLPLFCVWIKFS